MADKLRAAIDALISLTSRDPTPEYYTDFAEQINAEKNDRGAVLLVGANLESTLETVLSRFFGQNRFRLLVGSDSRPLNSFNGKILTAYALSMYGEETLANLKIIRHIRNAFAHAKIPISFKTPEVEALCRRLTSLPYLNADIGDEARAATDKLQGLERFKHVCDWIAIRLRERWLNGPAEINPDALKVSLPEGHGRIVVLPRALP